MPDDFQQLYQQIKEECKSKVTDADKSVIALYDAAQSSNNPEISAGADPLVKIFIREHADMLHQQQKPQQLGTPTDFFRWLMNKPRFK